MERIDGSVVQGLALMKLDEPVSRRVVNRQLLKSAFSIAATLAALRGAKALAHNGDGQPPILVEQPPGAGVNARIQRRLTSSVEVIDGQANWVIKGSGFSEGRIDLNALGAKSGEPVWLLGPFDAIFGPSFSFVTNLHPCKGAPVQNVIDVTAWDNGTGKASNTISLALC